MRGRERNEWSGRESAVGRGEIVERKRKRVNGSSRKMCGGTCCRRRCSQEASCSRGEMKSRGSVGPGYVLKTGRVNASRTEGMTVDPTRMTRTVWSAVIGLPFPGTGVKQEA